MADWKYIMIEVDGCHIPIIFPSRLAHVDVSRAMHRVVSENGKKFAPTVSAGFLSGMIVASAHGSSESLGDLKSRGRIDRALINEMPYAHGLTDGIACESIVIESALKLLGEAFIGSEDLLVDDDHPPKKAKKYSGAQYCKSCNARPGHHHRAGCAYG